MMFGPIHSRPVDAFAATMIFIMLISTPTESRLGGFASLIRRRLRNGKSGMLTIQHAGPNGILGELRARARQETASPTDGIIPTSTPSESPQPSPSPSMVPSVTPPSDSPSQSPFPSPSPSATPSTSVAPTPTPSLGTPSTSMSPTVPTGSPTSSPAPSPSPSNTPSTSFPSGTPTGSPAPSPSPSRISPTRMPTVSMVPTGLPTGSPQPSPIPTTGPTKAPSMAPSVSDSPTSIPTSSPMPSPGPTNNPTETQQPSRSPTPLPTVSNEPSMTQVPSMTIVPSLGPSVSTEPSVSLRPSNTPSISDEPSTSDVPTTSDRPSSGIAPPGTSVSVSVSADTAGQVGIPGTVEVSFPSGTFSNSVVATVAISDDPAIKENVVDLTDIFKPSGLLDFVVLVKVDELPTGSVEYTMAIPMDLAAKIGATGSIEAVVSVEQTGVGMSRFNTYQMIPSVIDKDTSTVSLSIPPAGFSSLTIGAGGTFQAVVTLLLSGGSKLPAPTRRLQSAGGIVVEEDQDSLLPMYRFLQLATCEAASLHCPIDDCSTPLNEFSVAFDHPSTDAKALSGVTLAAAQGSIVTASTPGTVVSVRSNQKQYGNYVTIDTGGTFRVRYGFLDTTSVFVGQPIATGDTVGTVGSSGAAITPQLFIGYAPQGSLFTEKRTIDPLPCFGPTVRGSIEIRDPSAKATLNVSLNGALVGQTKADGVVNQISLNGLTAGDKVIGVDVVDTPTPVKVEIQLNDGLTFLDDGSIFRKTPTETASLSTGGFISETIGVPTVITTPTQSVTPSISLVPSMTP